GNSLGAATSVVATLTVREMDFGDAPLPYPTLMSNNGARHVIVPGFFLGSGVDVDPDGRPSVQADGDDTTGSNDEDGGQFLGPLYAGQPVTVSIVASTNGLLDAWIDYNGNGDWNDFDEQIFGSQPLLPGTNLFTLMVPPGAIPGLRYARFRLSSVGNLFS